MRSTVYLNWMVAPSSESMVEPNTPAVTPSGNTPNSQGADYSCVESKLATKKLTPTNKPPAALAAVPSTLMPPASTTRATGAPENR